MIDIFSVQLVYVIQSLLFNAQGIGTLFGKYQLSVSRVMHEFFTLIL